MKRLRNNHKLFRCYTGQNLPEYSLILALGCVAVIGSITFLGQNISDMMTKLSAQIVAVSPSSSSTAAPTAGVDSTGPSLTIPGYAIQGIYYPPSAIPGSAAPSNSNPAASMMDSNQTTVSASSGDFQSMSGANQLAAPAPSTSDTACIGGSSGCNASVGMDHL